MNSLVKKCLFIGAVLTSSTSFAQDPLTNKEVISLQMAKVSQDIILTKISASKCTFDLTAQGLIELDAAKVSDRIIKSMLISSPPKAILKNQDVIRIAKSEVSTSILREVIKLSPHKFEVTPEALILLKNEKVPDSVVKDMLMSPSQEGLSTPTEIKSVNTNGSTKAESPAVTTKSTPTNQGADIIVTNAFEEVKGLKRVGEFPATVSQIFGVQDKLRIKCLEKIKKDALLKGVTHLLIQSEHFSPNTMSVICVGYKK